METTESIDITPIPPTAATDELSKLWQDYLQKCCEVGQIGYQIEQLEGQLKQVEKHYEVTKAAVKSAAARHRELQAKQVADKKPESH